MKKDQGSTNHEYENEIMSLYLQRLIMIWVLLLWACTSGTISKLDLEKINRSIGILFKCFLLNLLTH